MTRTELSRLWLTFVLLGGDVWGLCGSTDGRCLRGPVKHPTQGFARHLYSGEADVAEHGVDNSSEPRSKAWTRLGQVAAVVLLAAGCSSSSDEPASLAAPDDSRPATSATQRSSSTSAPSGPSTSTSTPPEETDSIEKQIIDRYIGYWDARFAANSGTPNPDDPALRDFATGAQLDAVIAETRNNLQDGIALRPPDEPTNFQRVEVIEIDGDHAVVQECVVDDQVVIRRDSGEVINDAVATHSVRGELQRIDGIWRVSEARLVQRWEGVAGCASAP